MRKYISEIAYLRLFYNKCSINGVFLTSGLIKQHRMCIFDFLFFKELNV